VKFRAVGKEGVTFRRELRDREALWHDLRRNRR
jgi:hypothetical protein